MKNDMESEYEKYNRSIYLLEDLFKNLFIKMIDYKNTEKNKQYKNLDYRKLAVIIPKYYPKYSQDIINLTHLEYRENNTYLDVISSMLSLYTYFLNTYKELPENDEDYNIEIDI